MNSDKAAINNRLVDKETNLVESTLSILNINSSFHLNNFTCKLVQYDQELTLESTTSSINNQYNDDEMYADLNSKNQEQLWQSSDTITLNVAYKPLVTIDLFAMGKKPLVAGENDDDKMISLYEDDDVSFKCKQKSNPIDPLNIVWTVDNVVQSDFNNQKTFKWLKRTNRFMASSSLSNMMNVTCQVANTIGSGHFTYQVAVLHEPKMTLEKKVYDVDEFSFLKINCSVSASPVATTIEWRKYDLNSDIPVLVIKKMA